MAKHSGLPFRRKCIQLASALIYNANIKGFRDATIYQGKLKGMCVPGLNCYSCPGASFSCPLGTLQNALCSIKYRIPMYIFGIFILFGLLFGRIICGFLCPFGLLQELLHKIPLPKIKKGRVTRCLSWLKYIILIIFVIYIPLYIGVSKGMSVPAFCKYICPAGTLEGGLPLVAGNKSLQKLIGSLFSWKVFLLVLILLSAIVLYRSFCRFLCPLGAIYALFSKISIMGIKVDKGKCTDCNACIRHCKMDIKKVGDRECIQCGECQDVCPTDAICFKNLREKEKKCNEEA